MSASPPGVQSAASTGTSATNPTIALTDLKAKVTEIDGWLGENGGSADQRTCVEDYYLLSNSDIPVEGPDSFRVKMGSMKSGLPAGTLAWSDHGGTVHGDIRDRFWLEGDGADLFEVELGTVEPYDVDGDGTNDT